MAQSRLTLAIAGTLAVHLTLAIAIDVATVVGRDEDAPPPPRLTLVDLDTRPLEPPPPPVEPAEAPPPPEVPEVAPPPPPVPPTRTSPPPRARAPPAAATTAPPPASDAPPEPADPGGGPVVQLPGIAPAARGVPVAPGQPTTRRVGGGGTGAGPGSGSGAGSGSGPPPVAPTSVASIKRPAEAKAGFDYFDARKSYPAEARRLGVEGKIRVRLLVDATGKVTQARLLGGLGHGLDELALARARAIEFEPALDSDDRPVASVVIWTFTFTLPSDT